MKVLDHGFITIKKSMGDDAEILSDIWHVDPEDATTPRNVRRLRNLIRDRHTSAIEGVEFKFSVKLPIFIDRQWKRHRTWSYNEKSGRASQFDGDCYVPERQDITGQTSHMGRGRALPVWKVDLSRLIYQLIPKITFLAYRILLKLDNGNELARIVLPLSLYTEMVAKTDLNNLFKFLNERQSPRAQWEMRQYANAIAELIEPVVPVTYGAFESLRDKKS